MANAGTTTVPPSWMVWVTERANPSSTVARSGRVTSAYVDSQSTTSASGRAVVPESKRWSSVLKSAVYSRLVSPSSTRTWALPGMWPASKNVTSWPAASNGSP